MVDNQYYSKNNYENACFTCIYGCNQLSLTFPDFQNHFLNIHLKNNFLSKQFQEDLLEDFEPSEAREFETKNLKNLTIHKYWNLLQKNPPRFEDNMNNFDGIKLYENDTEHINDIHATSHDDSNSDSKTISEPVSITITPSDQNSNKSSSIENQEAREKMFKIWIDLSFLQIMLGFLFATIPLIWALFSCPNNLHQLYFKSSNPMVPPIILMPIFGITSGIVDLFLMSFQRKNIFAAAKGRKSYQFLKCIRVVICIFKIILFFGNCFYVFMVPFLIVINNPEGSHLAFLILGMILAIFNVSITIIKYARYNILSNANVLYF